MMNQNKFQFPSLQMEKIGKVLKLVSGSLSPKKRQLRFKNHNLKSNDFQQYSPKLKPTFILKQNESKINNQKRKSSISKQECKQNKNESSFCNSKNVLVFASKNSGVFFKEQSQKVNLSPVKASFQTQNIEQFDKKSSRSEYNLAYKNSKENINQKAFANKFKLRKINSSQNYRVSKSVGLKQMNNKKLSSIQIGFQFQPWQNPQFEHHQQLQVMFKP